MRTVLHRLQGIEWSGPEVPTYVLVDPITKAIVISAPSAEQLRLLVFGVPGWQQGTAELPDKAQSITKWNQLQATVQSLGHQGRGVGTRFSLTPHGVLGAQEHYEKAGVYSLEINRARIANRIGQSFAHIALERLRLKAHARFAGEEKAVARVHQKLGDVDIAVYDQPPAGRRQQEARGVAYDSDDRLVIVRAPLECLKLGEISLKNLSHIDKLG